jgi:CRP/FNR family cyclic AMP-dependent transcriptional regulator
MSRERDDIGQSRIGIFGLSPGLAGRASVHHNRLGRLIVPMRSCVQRLELPRTTGRLLVASERSKKARYLSRNASAVALAPRQTRKLKIPVGSVAFVAVPKIGSKGSRKMARGPRSKQPEMPGRNGSRGRTAKPEFDLGLFFETAAEGRSISTHQKNEVIFSQGDVADTVFYIKKGKVKVTVVSKQGKEAVVALLGTDEFVGEGCLIGQPKRLAAAVTMSESTIMRVGKKEIQRLLQDEPAFSQMFVSHILARKDRVEEDLVDQLFNSTEKRLARLLLLLANFGKEGRPEPIVAKISQEVLAEMIGTTRSRVSHFMNKFRELGFIDYNGHLEVHSSLLSVVLSEPGRTVGP